MYLKKDVGWVRINYGITDWQTVKSMYLTNPLIVNTFLEQGYNFMLMVHYKLFFNIFHWIVQSKGKWKLEWPMNRLVWSSTQDTESTPKTLSHLYRRTKTVVQYCWSITSPYYVYISWYREMSYLSYNVSKIQSREVTVHT